MIRRDEPSVAPSPPSAPEWGSDVVAEMLRRLRIPYIALMPGASFRGLHDSIVNYLGNDGPSMILCNHEEVAVAVAHGYAKMTGRAMAAAVHSTVGLMHATMTIFCAWCDRQPVLIFGGTGPMDATARRPWIEWIHTADDQGELVRDFTKWEHQPASVAAIPEAVLRAWQLAHVEPRGPVYVCLDVALQEQKLASPVSIPEVSRVAAPTPPAPDPGALERAAKILVEAEHPLILLGHTSAGEQVWSDLIALAESCGAAVTTDRSGPTSFPTDHPLHQGSWRSQSHDAVVEEIRDADAILSLQKLDVAGALRSRKGTPVRLINVSLEPYITRSWSADYQALPLAEIALTADADLTVAALKDAVARLLADAPAARRRAADRAKALAARSRERRAALTAGNEKRRDDVPIHLARVLTELRSALGDRAADTIVAQAPLGPWPTTAWDFSRPRAHLGHDGGGGVGSGPGIAVGGALGARGTGRPVVAILGDGELLAAPTALWTAAHHQIPILFVVKNNQSYYNDEEHQDRVARDRGRPPENRWIGQRMDTPPVDFAGLARDMGVEGIGPIAQPAELAAAMKRAVAILDEGRPAVVDVRVAAR
ncbi:MAG: thiamine pyrophosphate-binding protein [Chloroflexota bacterium]|nr:thiamine pyrophosphate-binding protein [Chloroflexota bacterium]